ncbi:metallophosphoesterase [bacterium]|nr:metallophosphoesterase [bacterium]
MGNDESARPSSGIEGHIGRRRFIQAAGAGLGALAVGSRLAGAQATADRESFFFIQMADPQLFWGKNALKDWAGAIDHANRLKPAFVVVCGDLLNRDGDPAKVDLARDEERAKAYLAEAKRLSEDIPLYNVAGNHDVCNEPTPASLAWYEARFGKPWYTFTHGACLFLVLQSDSLKNPKGVPAVAEWQMAWLRETLARADTKALPQRIVCMHHPMCLKSADEKDQYFNMPGAVRAELLALFHAHGVRAVFSGHYHGNAHVDDKEIQLVTSSAVSKSLRKDPPGFRIVKVAPGGVEHTYYAYKDLPEKVAL